MRQRVPGVQRLPADLQLQLKRHIQVFLAEKPFIGCGGLVVTEEMRVTVAAQACLLLNRRNRYFPHLLQILPHPGAFVVDRVHADGSGVLQNRRRALSGESWSEGQVILSWEDVLAGATDPAEFFAVASETFFERPAQLAARHPALFGELGRLYRVNPMSW